MKKDLNILKYKDVSVKTSSSQKNIFFIIIAVGIIVILLSALLFLKTNSNLENLKKINNDLQTEKNTYEIRKNRYRTDRLEKELDEMKKTIKNDKKIVDDILGHTGSLNYGILQDLLEKPDASTKIKLGYGNLLKARESFGENATFIKLDGSPLYEIDGQNFKATLDWVIYAPKKIDTPNSYDIDIFNENYVLKKYKKYLQELLVNATKEGDKELIILPEFNQGKYEGSDTSSNDEKSKYEKYSFKLTISMSINDYNKVIKILNEKYGA